MLVHRRVTPSIKLAGTHLYTWVERGTVRVKCLAQEHNTMSPIRARTRTARSGDERTNHEATAPPTISNTINQSINQSIYNQPLSATISQSCEVFEECNRWFSSYSYLVCPLSGSSQSCGTVVLFRPVFSLVSTSRDSNGRFTACDFLYPDKRFRVISLYAPNTNPQKDDFLPMLPPWGICPCPPFFVETSTRSSTVT